MTPLLPEQERALRYAQVKGTEASAAEVCRRLAATYAAVEAMVAAIDAGTAAAHRATSGWCIHEVVDHLILSHQPVSGQLADLLAGRDVARAIPAHLQSADPHGVSWPTLREQLQAVHASVLAVLKGATDDSSMAATAPIHMVVKCALPDGTMKGVEWEHRFDWKGYVTLVHAHNREHMAQMQRILDAAS